MGLILYGPRGPVTESGRFGAAIVALIRFPASDAPNSRTVLLKVDHMLANIIEDVLFDGGSRAGSCLQILGQNSYQTQVRRCGFRGATHSLLVLGPHMGADAPLHDAPPAAGSVAPRRELDAQDLSGVTFDGCDFFAGASAGIAAGAVLNAWNALPVVFRRCVFRGAASAMIHAFGGTFTVRSCRFDNAMPPDARSDHDMVRDVPLGGVDVFLGNPPIAGDLPVPPVRVTIGGVEYKLININPTAAAAFHAVDVESTSWQFLDTTRQANPSTSHVERWPTVLEGVRHRADRAGAAAAPPAIEWFDPGVATGGGMDLVGGQLTLVGCTFAGKRPGTADLGNGFGAISDAPPSGVVVADRRAALISVVGCSLESPADEFLAVTTMTASTHRFEAIERGSVDPLGRSYRFL